MSNYDLEMLTKEQLIRFFIDDMDVSPTELDIAYFLKNEKHNE